MDEHEEEVTDGKDPSEWTLPERKKACAYHCVLTDKYAIAEVINDTTSDRIFLDGKGINDADIPFIVSAICPRHVCLSLCHNNITDNGFNQLIQMLSNKKTENLRIFLFGNNPGTSSSLRNVMNAWGPPIDAEKSVSSKEVISLNTINIQPGYNTFNTGRRSAFLCGSIKEESMITGNNLYPFHVHADHPTFTYETVPDTTKKITLLGSINNVEDTVQLLQRLSLDIEVILEPSETNMIHESIVQELERRKQMFN